MPRGGAEFKRFQAPAEQVDVVNGLGALIAAIDQPVSGPRRRCAQPRCAGPPVRSKRSSPWPASGLLSSYAPSLVEAAAGGKWQKVGGLEAYSSHPWDRSPFPFLAGDLPGRYPLGCAPFRRTAVKNAIYPSLKDKVVFISGGASGIGESIVRHFAEQGCKVGFVDIADDAAEALIADIGRDSPGCSTSIATSPIWRRYSEPSKACAGARADHDPGEQRRARRTPHDRRSDARILGRSHRRQPASISSSPSQAI